MPSSSVPSPKYDANKAYPLNRNNANNPNPDPHRLCYHRFQDATGTSHEIFVPPGKEREIIELEDNEDWDALLSRFPPFSDRPPVFTVQPNCLEVPLGPHGTTKRFYIPEDQAKQDRVCELVIAEDYRTLERSLSFGMISSRHIAMYRGMKNGCVVLSGAPMREKKRKRRGRSSSSSSRLSR